jgi:hypothetical protein
MAVTSRQGLIEYCLRQLGEPVVEINIDDSQIEDRVDEAIEYWRQYHYDGIERVYLKQRITASRITITTSVGQNFALSETVTGSTSGATAQITREANSNGWESSDGTTLIVRNVKGTFTNGETITGSESGTIATLAPANAVTLGTYDNKYLDLPDLVYGINRVMPFSGVTSSKNLFDLQYQLRLNDLYDLTSTSIIYYKQVMSHLALLDLELNGHPLYRFNRMQGRLFLDINWETDLILGEYIIVECYRALDPTVWTKVFNEPWLKHYTTALIKKQWATNIKKFSGISLPGGVTLDGNQLYDEAMNEINQLEEELVNKSAPLEFFLG